MNQKMKKIILPILIFEICSFSIATKSVSAYEGMYQFNGSEAKEFIFHDLSPGDVISLSFKIIEGDLVIFKIGPNTSISEGLDNGVTTFTGKFDLNMAYTIGGFDFNSGDYKIFINGSQGSVIEYEFKLKIPFNIWIPLSSIGLTTSIVFFILWKKK